MKSVSNFIVVGAQRSGSTYLYNLLAQHPEIAMAQPVRPEPKYFLNRAVNEVDLDGYFGTYFSAANESQHVLGEKSTSYYEVPAAADCIRAALPGTKIIFILRDPVHRAISNYYFSLNHGLETRTLEEVFIDDAPAPSLEGRTLSVNPFDYLGRGEYHRFVTIYQDRFPADQIFICTLEQLRVDDAELTRLYGFLGIDTTFRPENRQKVVNDSKKIAPVPAQVIEKLTGYYRDHNEKLAELTGLDLSAWVK
ncbi:sulfotransferase [Pseudomonas sp. JS3066]|uniref:sulfotransferase family protein n=1 Tax=Pseudomonas sp. JS3066 TaxID=3090665 RepID=UPI002E7C48AD|nr:sulfotransferase [Pseudomonas sp. JS3066]WVK92838.1 sulfotransferase [Pseudomonas sp. JS3066]